MLRIFAVAAVLGFACGCQGDPVGTVGADAGLPDATTDAAFDAGGYKWELVYEDPTAGPDDALHAIWGSAGYIVAVGSNALTVEFDGTTWDARNKTNGAHLFGVWGTSPDDVAAVGLYSFGGKPAIFYKNAGGWIVGGPFPPDMPALTGVWGVGTQKYFTSLDGRIYQDDPVNKPAQPYHLAVITGGCPIGNPVSPQLNGIDGTGLGNIMVVGDERLQAHRDGTDGWATFCALAPELHFSSVTAIPGSTDFYVGANFHGLYRWLGRSDPMVQIFEDRGFAGADKAYLHGMWAAHAALVVAVGSGGKVLLYDGSQDGAKTIPSPTSDDLYDVWGLNERTLYVVGKGARIWRLTLP